ncbi:Multiple C2 domain and transmembrane region protein 6 [Ranunculus cassubicifolius]
MAKLVVEVLDASDLMPKDGRGSANPFVEVDFDQQRHRTQTKQRDLNPVWNEKLVFNVSNPSELPESSIDVVMYNDSQGGHHKNFLGRVRISGVSIRAEQEAGVIRYPLEKRGLFSHIRGDIALRIYATHDARFSGGNMQGNLTEAEVPLQEIRNHNNMNGDDMMNDTKKHNKKKKKENDEVRTFHSIGHNHTGMPMPPPVSVPAFGSDMHKNMNMNMNSRPVTVEQKSDFMRVGPTPAIAMHMNLPGQSEFGLVETRPPLAARMGYRGGYKTASTFDLVEQMHYLYVTVVKARDLPAMDVTGSIDPYVEVRLGNYKGITKQFEKNQHPVWMQTFAFPREHLQSNMLEVVLKDKDVLTKDDFAGRVVFDITEVPLRVPPDSPLAPQWYRLEGHHGEKKQGEVMLAVWMGTQADESFSEAWMSDAHDISQEDLSNTRSKVYFSPRLFYLRLTVIEAQDLMPSDRSRPPDIYVKIQIGNQLRVTRPSAIRTHSPVWNDELMFVVPEHMDELIIITVEDRVAPNKDEAIGRLILPIGVARPRFDHKMVDARWFNLESPSSGIEEGEKKKEVKFASKIHLRLCLDVGYHVLDEATHFSSDLQPSAKQLQKPTIGILELGILSAKNLLPMKASSGRATDAYCVAKYGNKWVRTRTLLDTLAPRWNEQYTWEVYDPCTVITIGVFDNNHVHGHKDESRDQRIGKVRIRLSTLETDKVYTHYYPLLSLHPSGLKKTGELHLAIRFTCTAWVNMMTLYSRPLLPKMHYVQPIPVRHLDWLRHQAMQLVAARLGRAEPPLRRETVEYMLDVDYNMWSLRRSKANFNRIMSLLSGIVAVGRWFDGICNWTNPMTTCLVHVLFLILVCYPELILPTVFLYLFVIGLWNYRFRPRNPSHMDPRLSHADRAHPDELDEEFDTFPTSKPSDIVRMRYDRMRSVAGRIQTVAGDLATQGERVQALLSWRDPKATAIFIVISLFWAMFLYVTPIQVVAVLGGMYFLRHPRFRSRLPSVPFNFFKRLPAKSDMLL